MTMQDGSGVIVSHFGICVSDRERSRRFYTEALGFSFSHEVDFAKPIDILTETPGIDGHAEFLTRGQQRIELLSFRSPETTGRAEPRPMYQLGLTHMALTVEDLDVTAERIEALGGSVLRHTRIDLPLGMLMYCTDPDGIRLELCQMKQPD